MSKPEDNPTGVFPVPDQIPCKQTNRPLEGHPRWKSSEPYLNKVAILNALALRSGQIIVDAGCGDAYMAKFFAWALQGTATVYAVDQAEPDEVDLVQGYFMQGPETAAIHPVKADITAITPLAAASVDLVYLSNVFHIFSEDQVRGFNREVQRLLKPGGRLAIVTMVKRPTPIGPPLDMRRSPEELQRMIDLVPCGLSEVGAYHYLQIFQKDE